MRRQPWGTYHVKDAGKGPMLWQAKHLRVYLKDEQGLPASGGRAYHLLVVRNVLNPNELKYFISNACESTAVQTLLRVAFSRWKIERMFEDSKMKLGMDHFEVRKFQSISRHLILSCVSHLFLAEFRRRHAGRDAPAEGGEIPTLTINQIAAAVHKLAPRGARGGRRSRRMAETISAPLTITQPRNAEAAHSHRKRTIRNLHAKGIRLKDLRKCQWPRT